MKKYQFLKRFLACALVVIMTVTSAPLSGFVETDWSDFAIKARAAEYKGFYYEINDNEVTITGWNNSISSKLIIPETINGCKVTTIGESAFYFCGKLRSVKIPNSVTSIGEWAFTGSDLTGVTIPESVTSIDKYSFAFCKKLKSISVSKKNAYYSSCDYGVLYNKDKTTLIQYPAGNERVSFKIPNSVTSIGGYAFFECADLKYITIPNSVKSIGECAFCKCRSLKNITIPSSVTTIDDNAFAGCSGLKNVIIDNGVTSIGDRAFESCSGLKSIIIPDSVKSIGGKAFYECTGLTNASIGSGVKYIGDYVFTDCDRLTSIAIASGLTSIGERDFDYCTGLKQIAIPDTVKSIYKYAFFRCEKLKDVYYCGSRE